MINIRLGKRETLVNQETCVIMELSFNFYFPMVLQMVGPQESKRARIIIVKLDIILC